MCMMFYRGLIVGFLNNQNSMNFLSLVQVPWEFYKIKLHLGLITLLHLWPPLALPMLWKSFILKVDSDLRGVHTICPSVFPVFTLPRVKKVNPSYLCSRRVWGTGRWFPLALNKKRFTVIGWDICYSALETPISPSSTKLRKHCGQYVTRHTPLLWRFTQGVF